MDDESREICLCGRCHADYVAAGYDVRRDQCECECDACEICGRRGWAYVIEREGGAGRRGPDGKHRARKPAVKWVEHRAK